MRFVPKVVYRTAFAGVVPICVTAVACGGTVAGSGGSREGGGEEASMAQSVACAGFACMGGVGYQGFADAGDAMLFNVACVAFDGSSCGIQPPDAGVHDGSTAPDGSDASHPPGPCDGGGYGCLGVADAGFSVAAIGFDGSDHG
jgi:hypothetical protein